MEKFNEAIDDLKGRNEFGWKVIIGANIDVNNYGNSKNKKTAIESKIIKEFKPENIFYADYIAYFLNIWHKTHLHLKIENALEKFKSK